MKKSIDMDQVQFRSLVKATRNGQLCTVSWQVPIHFLSGSGTPLCVYRTITQAHKFVSYDEMKVHTMCTGERRDYLTGNHPLVARVLLTLRETLRYRRKAGLLRSRVKACRDDQYICWLSVQTLKPKDKQLRRGHEEHQLSLFPS